MQHIYSLRPGRPSTAASIENPLPSVSIAKSRKFIKNNISHAFRKSTGGVLAPELAKKLAKLIAMEKNLLRSYEDVSRERMDGAEALSLWAEEQEDDVSDVVDKIGVLLSELGDLEDMYVDRMDVHRKALKAIRDIEKTVQSIRNKKQKNADQIMKMKAKEDHDPLELEALENEAVRIEAESLVAEKQLSTITRDKVKSGFAYHFAAMQELGEKMAIIAGYGAHLLELLPETSPDVDPEAPQPKYDGYAASDAIIQEADQALTNWKGSQASVIAALSPRLSSMLSDVQSPTVQEPVEATEGDIPVPPRSKLRRKWSNDELDTVEEKEEIGVAA